MKKLHLVILPIDLHVREMGKRKDTDKEKGLKVMAVPILVRRIHKLQWFQFALMCCTTANLNGKS